MAKKKSNFIEQEEVINRAWIDTEGIMVLLPIGRSKADAVRREIEEQMENNNEFYFTTRPRLIPTRKIIEKYFIDVALIRREAAKMKRTSPVIQEERKGNTYEIPS